MATITQAARELMVEMLDAFGASQSGQPEMPAGRRDAVVALLTQALLNVVFCEAYRAALDAEVDRRGRDFKLRLLGREIPEFPEVQFYAEGFTNLSDEVLADAATSSDQLAAMIVEMYDETRREPGEWFYAVSPEDLLEVA